MKHEVTSLNTKKTLAASLKKLMEQKPLSKISVSEIIADCGVNRKTFYYHFQDIFALLKWMLEQEAINVVRSFDLLVDYEEAIEFVIDYVDANKHILNCAYDSMGRGEMKSFFYSDFFGIAETIIDRVEQEESIEVDTDFKLFLASFYTEAISGMLIAYFKNDKLIDRAKLVEYIELALRSSIPTILREKNIK